MRKLLAVCGVAGLLLLSLAVGAGASEYRGQVVFNGYGVPGALVTASQGGKRFGAITDAQGSYLFPDLSDGIWSVSIEMQAFSPMQRDVTIGPASEPGKWELSLLPAEQIKGLQTLAPTGTSATPAVPQANPVPKKNSKGSPTTPTNTSTPFQRADLNATRTVAPARGSMDEVPASSPANDAQNPSDLNEQAADGFLINGTANNSASSPFAIRQAFGNTRRGTRSLYSGMSGLVIDNSALDAQSYSLTGANTGKPAYNHLQGTFSFGGPLRIPHLVRNGPNFYVGYQFTRNRNVRTESGLVPTLAERSGDLSLAPGQIFDPANGLAFNGNQIPSDRISPQARYLLSLYPFPNFDGSTRYNYQIPVVGTTRQDGVQAHMNKTIRRKNQVSGTFSMQSARNDNPSLLGFLGTSRSLGSNLTTSWRHSFTQRFIGNFGYQFNRQSIRTQSFFGDRENISGLAGIAGNNQDSENWGPPTLVFSSGLTALTDAVPASMHNQTGAVSYGIIWNRRSHNLSSGVEYRRYQVNNISQQNPRGSFAFTGTSTLGNSLAALLPGARNDFAGFLLGIPDTVSIAFGNADKYFRSTSYEAYVADDWRMSPNFTINLGLRWEYYSPVAEMRGRLVNLDISPDFSAGAPVVGFNPAGSITGATYRDSLINPDRGSFQPRIGFSWRPMAASSMIVRGGYGIYYNASPYQTIATQMAQQSPLSKSLSLQNTAANPLTLADGFNAPPNTTANTFAANPDLRVGYLHIWQLSVQRDLPAALQLTAAYQGTRGRHALQEYLPNTYPTGAVNPCPTCPSGFVYLTSNGASSRESGSVQLRRRLHNGFSATAQYTFAKSMDDAAPGAKGQSGSIFIAQDWRHPEAERALSSFDQRHLLNVQLQYTSGMGAGGGTLLRGWRGVLFKEWTVTSQINVGTGFPLTPVYPVATAGTGVTGSVRPDYTGEDVQEAPAGRHLNPESYQVPAAGHWGNAGRNSITGPSQFTFNASLGRVFRTSDRTSLDLRVDANNALNHVTFPSWNTTVGNAQFGLPLTTNAMRNVQTTVRWRF